MKPDIEHLIFIKKNFNRQFDAYYQALFEANVVELQLLKARFRREAPESVRRIPFNRITTKLIRTYLPKIFEEMKGKFIKAWLGIRPLVYSVLLSLIKKNPKMSDYRDDIINEIYCRCNKYGHGWFFLPCRNILKGNKGKENRNRRRSLYAKALMTMINGSYKNILYRCHGTPYADCRISIDTLNIERNADDFETAVPTRYLDEIKINPYRRVETEIYREQIFPQILREMLDECRIDQEVFKECLRFHIGKMFNNSSSAGAFKFTKLKFEMSYTRYLLRKYIKKHNLTSEIFQDEDNLIFPSMPKVIANYLGLKYNEGEDLNINEQILELKNVLSQA